MIMAHLDTWTGNTMVGGQVQVNLIGNGDWTFVDPCFRMLRGFPQVEDLTQDQVDDNDVMGYSPQGDEVSEVESPSLANTEDLEGWGPHEPGLPERPDTPDGPEGSDLECSVPELGDGRLRLEHECRGHWPYDRGCDDCVQSRGRTPATIQSLYKRCKAWLIWGRSPPKRHPIAIQFSTMSAKFPLIFLQVPLCQ